MAWARNPTIPQQGVASMAIPTVNFLSYNSTGSYAEKCSFINTVCENNDVKFVSIQEHFRNNKTTDKYFCAKFDKYSPYVIPGYRPSGQDSGRPKAGLAQLSSKCLDIRKDRVKTDNYRIQAQVLNFQTSRILWINSYFPTDPQTMMYDDSELLDVLRDLTKIVETTEYTDIVLNGDLNWDPRRNTGFSKAVKSFVAKAGLVPLWEVHPVDFTHIHTDMSATSILDHFLVTERLVPLVDECKALHLGDNMSRHSPILLKLRVGEIPTKKKVASSVPRKPNWQKATGDVVAEYKADLQQKLEASPLPESLSCVDPQCGDPAHSQDRDSVMLDILCSVVESSHTVVPLAGGRRTGAGQSRSGVTSGSIPGWREQVEPFQEEARFWHGVWHSAGRPNSGDLHRAMAQARNQYHYAIRRTTRCGELQQAKSLFEASLSGDMDLIKEMKKVKSGCQVVKELPDNVG